MNGNKELKVHSIQLTGRSLCSIRSNRKWCKRRGSSLQCQNCFFVYTISDCNLKKLVTKDFLYYWYSTFLEKWSQKMLIFGVKSSFLELGILAVQKRELIIEEVHILIQMPIFLGLLKLFVDKCRNEWYIPI